MRYTIQRLGLLLIFGCILFGAAGTLHWPRAWAYLLAVLVMEGCTLVLLAVKAPDLLKQRSNPSRDMKGYDKVFFPLWLLLSFTTPLIAGLDAVRCQWSYLGWPWFFVGLALLFGAMTFAAWAMLENQYFEQFVRIQTERGHRVVSSGPYAIVRHPGYTGVIAGTLASPLLLGSMWTFVPAGLIAALFTWRTYQEDRTLRNELEGYAAYTETTCYRLVPGVW